MGRNMKILVTGRTNGMGKGVAKILAGMTQEKNELIILCRSQELGQKTIEELKTATPGAVVSIVLCDLARMSDVRSAVGFEIPKTVWTNQLNIIPRFMKAMATLMKWLGAFITIERCGEIMAPLFLESQESILEKSGKLYTWTKAGFLEKQEDEKVLNRASRQRLWKISMELCQSRSPT